MNVPIPWTPLYPSQRSGLATLESARWRGDWRDFWVQWHEERVYFQLVEGEPTVWASLESCGESEAVACFENAVGERRCGACFIEWAEVHRSKNPLMLHLHFIFAPDGTGFLREWFGRNWIAFAPKQTRGWVWFADPFEEQLQLPEHKDCCRYAAQSVHDELLMRRVSAEEIERLAWRSQTNEAEFERVMRWLWDARLLQFPASQRNLASVALGSCLPDTHTLREARGRVDALLQSRLSLPDPQSEADEQLAAWLRAYFVGEGFGWRTTEWGTRNYRKLRARATPARVFRAKLRLVGRPVSDGTDVSSATRSAPPTARLAER